MEQKGNGIRLREKKKISEGERIRKQQQLEYCRFLGEFAKQKKRDEGRESISSCTNEREFGRETGTIRVLEVPLAVSLIKRNVCKNICYFECFWSHLFVSFECDTMLVSRTPVLLGLKFNCFSICLMRTYTMPGLRLNAVRDKE